MTSYGLDEQILDKIVAVLRAHPVVERAAIYGSRATGTFRPESDIDLAVYAPTLSDHEFARLHFELDELPIVFKLDVVWVDRLRDGGLRSKIEREGLTVYPKVSRTRPTEET